MKWLLVLAVVVAAVSCKSIHVDHDLDVHWEKFKNVFNKRYSAAEEPKRRQAFEANVAKISSHNRKFDMGLSTYTLGLNEYADLTIHEFKARMNGFRGKVTRSAQLFKPNPKAAVPDTVDWRDKNIVTPIKNQEQCGSCWAFSTTGSVEGQWALAKNALVSLSEQNLVDCSGPEGNMGCGGGLMDYGFQYIIDNNGIDTEESYPYTAQDGDCQFNKANIGATISSYKDIPSGDEDALKQAVATIGPISVAIDASSEAFQLYSGGVYDDDRCSSTLLDHGVLAVGYGTDSGVDYWLVKNSWGETWGDTGYIKMSRNKNNQCGIATQSSYPVV